jgi:hypothetical protein
MKIRKPITQDELAPPANLPQEKQEFAAMYLIAYSDIETCIKRVNEDHTDFWKRSLFRSFFSFVEFTGFRLRYLLLAGLNDRTLTLSPEETLILQERTPELTEKGVLRLKNRFFSFEAYLRFTLQTYAKHFTVGDIDFSVDGWEAMKKSVVVRNLLTHPKTMQHLFVSKDELADLNKAMDWYFKTMRQFIVNWRD